MPTALITGASSGIGYDLAKLFARDQYRLVLTGRNVEALERVAAECAELSKAGTDVTAKDLADPAAPGELFGELERAGVAVDVLVNNAGFGVYGPFVETDLRTDLEMIQVNVSALTALTRLFLPGMVGRGAGRILNVASTAGFVPGPYLSVYYATKAYVVSHSVALAHELRRTGVTVTALCPGPTKTAFQRRAGMDKSKLFRMKAMESEEVARAGYRGMLAGKTLVVPGWRNQLAARASGLAPKELLARIAGKLNRGE